MKSSEDEEEMFIPTFIYSAWHYHWHGMNTRCWMGERAARRIEQEANEESKRPKVQIVQCVSPFSRVQHLEGKTMFFLVQHIMIKTMMMMMIMLVITEGVLKESSATIVYARMDGFFFAVVDGYI